MKAMSARVLLLGTMAAMGLAATAGAQTYWADPGADNWFDAANWTAGVPTSSKNASIDNGGTAQIAASNALSQQLTVGYTADTGAGAVEQTGGTHTVSNTLILGFYFGSEGAYTLSDGTLSVGSTVFVGYSHSGSSGTGTFTQTGGTHTISSFLYLGSYSGSEGTYTLSDGTLSVGSRCTVGIEGTGTFTQTGGTHTVGEIYLGFELGSEGTYTLADGSLSVGSTSYVGRSGTGTFNQTGGTHTVGQDLSIGSKGVYHLGGGTLSVTGNVTGSSGILDVSGGSFQMGGTIPNLAFGYESGSDVTYALPGAVNLSVSNLTVGYSGSAQVTHSQGDHTVSTLYVGRESGSAGTYALSGGSLGGSTRYVGYSGTGTFNQTGGTHTVNSSLYLGYNSGSAGTYTLSDGCLSVGAYAYVGFSGTGTFTQTGGTHTVNSSLYLGHNSGSAGTYTLSYGSLTAASAYVGSSGSGTFNQTGGTHDVDGDLILGDSSGSEGTYTLSDGSLSVVATAYVGNSGTGTFNQTGGENTAGSLDVGRDGLYALSGGSLSAARLFVSEGGRFETTGGTFDATDFLSVTGTLVVTGCTQAIQGKVTVSQTGAVEVNSGTFSAPTVDVAGCVSLAGGTLAANAISLGGTAGGRIEGFGTVAGRVTGDIFSEFEASGGALSLGDPGSWTGFSTTGGLKVGSETVTLYSRAFATLGNLTELAGGTLAAPNGIALGPGANLVGWGTVDTKVAAGFGSTIAATDDLTLGKSNAYDGFFSDGSLLTGAHTVTIQDRNMAVLGSLTQLGDGSDGGTLTAGNANPADTYAHFLLEQGKNLVGRGYVNGHFKNHGDIVGDGVAMIERLIFNSPWIVSGKGTFENTLIEGTFAPGESPCITTGTNQGFGGTVEIDLGGTQPGFGDDNHDRINDTATILLFGSPTLEILPWNNFVPQIGDEFVILTWQTELDGIFGSVKVAPWFTSQGINFGLHYNNVSGAGNLMLEATPEPATLALLALGGAALAARRRKG